MTLSYDVKGFYMHYNMRCMSILMFHLIVLKIFMQYDSSKDIFIYTFSFINFICINIDMIIHIRDFHRYKYDRKSIVPYIGFLSPVMFIKCYTLADFIGVSIGVICYITNSIQCLKEVYKIESEYSIFVNLLNENTTLLSTENNIEVYTL